MTTIAIETTAAPAVENGAVLFIPLNKLKKHPDNARKTPHSEASIEATSSPSSTLSPGLDRAAGRA